ncbi:hypothetical protein niasHT_039787 [Heterodera trifolii]|uniref:Amiloride-sensitive sodium channel n=1 Tax=Heterodera trifolii TaxID=157864 RepID=A0ABD2IUM2_9BILA
MLWTAKCQANSNENVREIGVYLPKFPFPFCVNCDTLNLRRHSKSSVIGDQLTQLTTKKSATATAAPEGQSLRHPRDRSPSNSNSSSSTISRRSSSYSPLPLGAAGANAEPTVSSYCTMLTQNTTFHGIRDTVQTSGHLRLLWLAIVILATFAALVGCALIVWEYNTRPLVVTYGIKEDVSLTLPDIVVCPFNRFNRSFLLSHNVSAPLAQYLELAFPSPAQHPFQYELYTKMIAQQRMDQMESELSKLLEKVGGRMAGDSNGNSQIAFTEFVKRSAIACQAFFVDPRTCETAEEIMTSAGKCFRLRGGEQRSDGFGHGQRIILRLPKKLYNPGVNQMLNDGVVVKLAERGKGIDHDMSFVPSGVHAIFPLTATRYEFKNYPPHFKCREDDPSGVYSRVWCFEDCFMSQAERDCNCSLAAASRPTTPYICTTSQFFRCVYPKLYRKGFEERIARCKSHCGPPCNYWRFDKTVTYSLFPSEQAKHFVNDSSKWEELRNTIILDVYYITLDYTIIRHMLSMTPPSFVAQLGGQISLWIGGSIISIIQLFIYLSSAFCAYLRRGATKRRRTTTTTMRRDGIIIGHEREGKKKCQRNTEKRRRKGERKRDVIFGPRLNKDEMTFMSVQV